MTTWVLTWSRQKRGVARSEFHYLRSIRLMPILFEINRNAVARAEHLQGEAGS